MDALVALEGGPEGSFWYWLADWNTKRESARAWHLSDDQPLPSVLRYEPTGRMKDNPDPRYGKGEVWRYVPPAVDADAGPTIVLLSSGVPAMMCPRCGRPAPDLITFPAQDGPSIRECPRCAYPPQRYLGDYVETMPDTYLDWYEAHDGESVTANDRV